MLARTGEGGEAEEGRHGTAGTPAKKLFAQDNNVKTRRTLLGGRGPAGVGGDTLSREEEVDGTGDCCSETNRWDLRGEPPSQLLSSGVSELHGNGS